MQSAETKPRRGRPKTFDPSRVLGLAMRAYWEEGHTAVSLNSVCARAGVAKTSVYKEFGSEDGLKQAVIIDYHKMTLAPLYEMLNGELPFKTALAALSDYILQDHPANGIPNGCLLVDMCQNRSQLGDLTRDQVERFQALSVDTYERWFEKAVANGEVDLPVSPRTAALFVDAQIATIMNMQRQGATPREVETVFKLALSVFE